jgi:hypothetical protein
MGGSGGVHDDGYDGYGNSNTEAGERIAVVCGLARMSMVALRAVSCRTTNHERTINTTAFFVGGIENEKG